MSVGLRELVVQQQITNRLLVHLIWLKDPPPVELIVGMLASTGASDEELAAILSTTPQTIAMARQRNKKGKGHEETDALAAQTDQDEVLGASPPGEGDPGE